MTSIISFYNVPKNDITIRPIIMINEINKIFTKIKDDFEYKNEKYMKVLHTIIGELRYNINKQYFWYLISSEKICSHTFTTNSKKFGMMCGKRIDITCKKDKYKCSEHVNKNHIPKKRNKDGKVLCKNLNKHKKPCELEGKYEGYCKYHYKPDNNTNIKEVIKKNIETMDKINNTNKCNNFLKRVKKKENIVISFNGEYNYIKEIVDKSFNVDKLYEIVEEVKNNNINYILEPLNNVIKEIKEENNLFLQKTKKVLDKEKEDKSDNLIFDKSLLIGINSYDVITKIINNSTYVSINYLEKQLKTYNLKFKNFEKEIKDDFPKIYKKLHGYFEIAEDTFNNDIKRVIEYSKIISIII